jgi:hypothetical protein
MTCQALYKKELADLDMEHAFRLQKSRMNKEKKIVSFVKRFSQFNLFTLISFRLTSSRLI